MLQPRLVAVTNKRGTDTDTGPAGIWDLTSMFPAFRQASGAVEHKDSVQGMYKCTLNQAAVNNRARHLLGTTHAHRTVLTSYCWGHYYPATYRHNIDSPSVGRVVSTWPRLSTPPCRECGGL